MLAVYESLRTKHPVHPIPTNKVIPFMGIIQRAAFPMCPDDPICNDTLPLINTLTHQRFQAINHPDAR